MKLYKKRIAFLISDQHLIAHGGIGQFAKGFTEMCQQLEWKVDIILDKAPTSKFSEVVESFGANIIYPADTLRYSSHTATFAFTDSVNFEKVVNFRKSMMYAFETNIYDMIVCNTNEAMTAVYALGISKYIPIVFYTHPYSMVFRDKQDFSDACGDAYHSFFNKHLEFTDIFVGTQSDRNVTELLNHGAVNATLLLMPIPERELLEPYTGPQEGVLFIGRWEERKNPAAYLKVMKELQLPCRVMTNSTGAAKFKKAFEAAGITDYIIKAGIIGQEKVDFIKSCKVFFMPALGESYGFAFVECLGHMPCVVLDNQEWSDNFDSKYFYKEKLEDTANLIRSLYYSDDDYYITGALDYINQLANKTADSWVALLNNFVAKRSNSNVAKINNSHTVQYRQFITDLNRSNLAQEDIVSVLGNKHKFTLVYTDTDSYLSKDVNFVPEDLSVGVAGDEPTELAGSSLFVFG